MTSCSFASGLKLLMLQHHVVVPLLHGARERCTNSAVVISSHVCVYLPRQTHTHTNTIGGSLYSHTCHTSSEYIVIPHHTPITSHYVTIFAWLHHVTSAFLMVKELKHQTTSCGCNSTLGSPSPLVTCAGPCSAREGHGHR